MARSKARKLADILSEGNTLDDGVISASEVVGLGTAAATAATDYATAAQGTLAASALQPTGDGSGLSGVASAAQGALADTSLQPALAGVTSVDATTVAALAAAGVGGSTIAAATGGTVTTDGDYKVHKFTSNGTFSVTTPGPIQFLIVSGGGAGGRGESGSGSAGGGGGGHFLGQFLATVTGDYAVIVGAGGVKDTGPNPLASGQVSAIYGPEVFNNTVPGGGQGGGYSNTQGQNGASGGGGQSGNPGGRGTHPFGNDGGNGVSGQDGGPGGGGAGGVGANAIAGNYNGRAGGAGVAYTITGSTVYYAAGGGGGARSTASGGAGGSGVGGAGGNSSTSAGAPVANSGSGGGGGGDGYGQNSHGATGVVIFRYKFR